MKKLLVKTLPGFFLVTVTCCGGTLSDVLNEADYTKYKAEKEKKMEVLLRKKLFISPPSF